MSLLSLNQLRRPSDARLILQAHGLPPTRATTVGGARSKSGIDRRLHEIASLQQPASGF